MRSLIISALCLMTAIFGYAENPVVYISDIIGLFDFKSVIAFGKNEDKEADELLEKAYQVFTAQGFTPGLTGDGYGGPCVIIDGFYKGGVPDTTLYCFEPGLNKDRACVIEMAACNDGDVGDFELYMSIEMFSEHAARLFVNQFGDNGFKPVAGLAEDDDHCSFTNGKYVIDYSHETGYADDCHYFIVQTVDRKRRIDN